jgi:hypothetical protein
VLKAVTLGLILFVIGLLIIGYGFSRPFDFLTPFIGFIILGIGVWIFATKFKQWVREH